MSKIDFFRNRVESTFSPMDYMQAIKQDHSEYVLVDVRNGPIELKKEKIQGAIEIPLSELNTRMAELPKEKNVIVYCWDVWCNTAAKACVTLLENGYKTKELNGGIAAWKTMNFPITSLLATEPSNEECGC